MKQSLSTILLLLLFWSCTNETHFISDKSYREEVERKFNERKEMASSREDALFRVMDQDISQEEKEALMFLYAYMPLNDLADYDGDFFLKQVRASFDAKASFPWGKEIPEDIFRHFVLPYRVNNENMDSARWVFLEELKPRLQGLSMKDAALEVNHWCHEKVNYAPTDIRTSAPLSTVRTSWGRCGEESTFTVSAMRAAGIPARQVYTPRWAHCDDNHAWVEVWTDGKWSYLGACEPEPDLNIGWFTEPARRAMLVHTKVFGDYAAEDEVITKDKNFTEINVVPNYAEVKRIYVKVKDAEGQASPNTKVDFGLYNYAEFYPIAQKTTDDKGLVSLTTGYGDLLVNAHQGELLANAKLNVEATDTLTLVLGEGLYNTEVLEMTFTPPIERIPYLLDEEAEKANQTRLDQEDEIRNTYKASFIDSVAAYQFAASKSLDPKKCWSLLQQSQGNWKSIQTYLQNNASPQAKIDPIALLEVVSAKDLRDVDYPVLQDHLQTATTHYLPEEYASANIYKQYVLNPRIKNEKLVAYRNFLYQAFHTPDEISRDAEVERVKNWIIKNIQLNDKENYYSLPITPIGVYELKIANKASRDIFFVAVCRSLGIPSRLEPTQKTPQYFDGEQWENIQFEANQEKIEKKGLLTLENNSQMEDPAYYTHFTIGKLKNGTYHTLDYGWDTKFSAMQQPLELNEGTYRLITGQRGLDGSVYTVIHHFNIKDGEDKNIVMQFRDPAKAKESLGELDTSIILYGHGDNPFPLSEIKEEKSIVIAFLDRGTEPTRHFIEELNYHQKDYLDWGGDMIFLSTDAATPLEPDVFIDNKLLNNLILFGYDKDDVLNNHLKEALALQEKPSYPWVLLINPKREITLSSQGYKIGIHDYILKNVKGE